MFNIQTIFAGVEHRSRTEGQWAAFLRTLWVPYIYEPEGYQLVVDGRIVRYLPDFLLPRLDIYLEVKPWQSLTPEQQAVQREFNRHKLIVVASGVPRCDRWYGHGYVLLWYRHGSERPERYLVAMCKRCGKLGICPESWRDGGHGGGPLALQCDCLCREEADFWNPRLLHAHFAAMRHKFGERGAPNYID